MAALEGKLPQEPPFRSSFVLKLISGCEWADFELWRTDFVSRLDLIRWTFRRGQSVRETPSCGFGRWASVSSGTVKGFILPAVMCAREKTLCHKEMLLKPAPGFRPATLLETHSWLTYTNTEVRNSPRFKVYTHFTAKENWLGYVLENKKRAKRCYRLVDGQGVGREYLICGKSGILSGGTLDEKYHRLTELPQKNELQDVFRLPHNAYRQLNSIRHARSCLSSYLPLTLSLQPEWSGSWVRRREISRDPWKKFSDSSIPSATFPSEWFRVWARFFLFQSLPYLAVPQRRNKPKIFLPDKVARKKKSEKEKLHSKPSHDFIPERGRADGVTKPLCRRKQTIKNTASLANGLDATILWT